MVICVDQIILYNSYAHYSLTRKRQRKRLASTGDVSVVFQRIDSIRIRAHEGREVILNVRSQRLVALPWTIITGLDEGDEDLRVDLGGGRVIK